MNVLDFFTGVYGKLHNHPGVPFWILTPFRKMVRGAANAILPGYLARKSQVSTVSGKGIIVSFTSFPARINDVWQVVESLKNQSVRPEKIILWLSKEQFPKPDDVPQSLKEREDALFEIRMVDGDIRSHKKYYYAMQEYPNKTVVTCDDDIYYHKDMLKALIEASRLFPGCIITNISKQLVFDDDNEDVLPYAKWDKTVTPFASKDRVQIGAGGVLYPPYSLPDVTLRKELFLDLAPFADDLWLNMTSRLNRTPVVQSGKEILPLSIKSKAPCLKTINAGAENMNDKQLAAMRHWLNQEGLEDVYKASYSVSPDILGGG